jgi:hypothetical protein
MMKYEKTVESVWLFGYLSFIRHSSFDFLFGHRQTDEPIECFTNRLWHKDIEE